jgi:hypothetical protein
MRLQMLRLILPLTLNALRAPEDTGQVGSEISHPDQLLVGNRLMMANAAARSNLAAPVRQRSAGSVRT